MAEITVPASFFRKEKENLYYEWRTAFWRELLSNSIDAGASNILIRARFGSKGEFLVDMVDNGSGMTRELITDVYMKLGESSKSGTDDGVGGFGRARILTCFGQNKYQIRSGDFVVKGEGASYDILDAASTVKGTAVSIDVDERRPRRLMNALYSVLEQSSLRCKVILDMPVEDPEGVLLPQPDETRVMKDEATGRLHYNGWTRKGTHFGTLDDTDGTWGELHVSRGAKGLKNKAIVRVNGVAMWDEAIPVNAQVTIDLVPNRSRQVMTISRDTLRSEYRQELHKLFQKIAADQESTFRQRKRDPIKQIKFGSSAPLRSIARPTDANQTNMSNPDVDLTAVRDMNAARRSNVRAPSDQLDALQHDGPTAEGEGSSPPAPLSLRNHVAIYIDSPTTAARAASRRYMPETWMGEGGEGRTAELLHAAWTAACAHTLGVLSQRHPGLEGESWATGFVFDAKMAACHVGIEGARHALLLNPVDDEGRQRFKLSDPKSMKQLVSLAIHECCHCVHDWHDEHFASLFTDLVGDIQDREILGEIKAELEQARNFIAIRTEAMKRPSEQLDSISYS